MLEAIWLELCCQAASSLIDVFTDRHGSRLLAEIMHQPLHRAAGNSERLSTHLPPHFAHAIDVEAGVERAPYRRLRGFAALEIRVVTGAMLEALWCPLLIRLTVRSAEVR